MNHRIKVRTRVFIALLLAAAVVIEQSRSVEASKTASTVSIAASSASLWHAGISFVAPNPVTPVTSFIYGCIGLGASIYDRVVDPVPVAAPTITAIVAGPATGRDVNSGELTANGPVITSAPAGRVVSILGTNFSYVEQENLVTFNGQAAAIAPLSTNTLISAVVPSISGPLPATIDVQVIVNGEASAPFTFTIRPAVAPAGNPGDLSRRVIAKQKLLTEAIRDFDWAHLLEVEAPDLTADQKAEALAAAAQMVQGANDMLPHFDDFNSLLDTDLNFAKASDNILQASPEVEKQLDAALQELQSADAPAKFTGRQADQEAAGLAELREANKRCAEPAATPVIGKNGKPVKRTLTGMPRSLNKLVVSNSKTGLNSVEVIVNGKKFKLKGLTASQNKIIDISAAVASKNNTITIIAYGKPGSSAAISASN